MKGAKILELSSVSKLYTLGEHTVAALNNVSLTIHQGEFVSIIGPSGSGKSTLMHIMGLLDVPTSGQVFLQGRDVSKLSEDQLSHIRNRKIGFVFQQYNLLDRTTSLENTLLPLIYSGQDTKTIENKARRALLSVGLQDRMDHFPNQLSGGQQQRVAIARALVTNTAIILADEPTGNLDTKTGKEIMELFKALNKKGTTVVIVTHERDIAREAKRAIQMRDGSIIKT